MSLPGSSGTELDYYGVKPCGCVTAWMSVDHASKADVRRFEKDMAASDRVVERAPFDRERIGAGVKCQHTPERARDLEEENARLRAELEASRAAA